MSLRRCLTRAARSWPWSVTSCPSLLSVRISEIVATHSAQKRSVFRRLLTNLFIISQAAGRTLYTLHKILTLSHHHGSYSTWEVLHSLQHFWLYNNTERFPSCPQIKVVISACKATFASLCCQTEIGISCYELFPSSVDCAPIVCVHEYIFLYLSTY